MSPRRYMVPVGEARRALVIVSGGSVEAETYVVDLPENAALVTVWDEHRCKRRPRRRTRLVGTLRSVR